MQSTPSLLVLLVPLLPEVVAPDKVLCIGLLEMFDI